jgi:hypothetical protein
MNANGQADIGYWQMIKMQKDPVAWITMSGLSYQQTGLNDRALYTHPHPDNLGLAESIIKQQQLEIEALKDEVAKWKMSYENCQRMCSGYGMN